MKISKEQIIPEKLHNGLFTTNIFSQVSANGKNDYTILI